jgi:hypothetical protein
MIKASPRAVIGFARLELLNEDSAIPVGVKNVWVCSPGEGPKFQATAIEFTLAPAQSKSVDLTSTVVKVLGANGKGQVQIRLQLNPQPADQPEATTCCYGETINGKVVEFRIYTGAAGADA